MKKKIIGIFVCMLLIITTVSSVPGIELMEKTSMVIFHNGNTLYVGGIMPGNYSKIQDAINDSSNGDTVFVYDDSSPYYENVVINKEINLFGENKDTTIIDGMQKSYVIDVQAHDVHIRGFTIKNGTKDLPNAPSGIWCQSSEGYSWNNLHIEHNIITENRNGINFLRSHNSNISNNIIKSNHGIGLHIWLSNNFTCQRNEITDQGSNAIFCLKTPDSDISYNMISENKYHALKISFECNNSLISNNIAIGNGFFSRSLGLFMSGNVTIRNNHLNNNVYWEIDIKDYCYNNLIYHNDVYGEPYDMEEASTWDDGYPSGGNYWSGYTGFDNDSDGIGDTPYYFQNGKDRYPLMQPYNDNWIPYARFSYLEDKNNVSFDASSSFDFQGSIVSYEWDFGDGETGDGETISHDYNGPGKYEVTLKVTDNDGTTDTYSWEVLLFTIPDLSCDGSLSWTDVKPGETVEGSFTVENIGESGTLLDWEVVDWPSDWGIWTFTPLSGDDLTPEDEEVTINVSVVAPDEKNSEFFGEIKVVNKENSSDFCIIDVSLSTPKNKPFIHNFPLLSWLFERFPNAFPILRHLIELL